MTPDHHLLRGISHKMTLGLVLTGLFMFLSPLVILLSSFILLQIEHERVGFENNNQVLGQMLEAVSDSPYITQTIQTQDARKILLTNYLAHYNSALAAHTDTILAVSEKYGLDFRLLVAIAQQESNLCKLIPENSYNCWGWGIHSQGTLKFGSFEEALNTIAKGLKEKYLDRGYTTPEKIMRKYTPSSPGTWAKGVNQFMHEIGTYQAY